MILQKQCVDAHITTYYLHMTPKDMGMQYLVDPIILSVNLPTVKSKMTATVITAPMPVPPMPSYKGLT